MKLLKTHDPKLASISLGKNRFFLKKENAFLFDIYT